ncbi:MAG: cell division protein ZapA [Bacillota bacterium]
MAKNKTIVNIGHHEYTLMGEESTEYIHRVAIFVDRRMKEIMASAVSVSDTMLAMLTAINIADEHLKLQDEAERIRSELTKAKEEIETLKRAGKDMKPLQVVPMGKTAPKPQADKKNNRV